MSENKILWRFVIDEALCVDTWGQSFRSSYAQLSTLKQFNRRTLTFTGTEMNQTKQRIVEKLGLVQPVILQSTG
jgi:superfamily II DNA helicase RecQ